MSLDERLRAARPVGDVPPIDLDAMLHGAMRGGRRRRNTWRAAVAAGVALILLLISIPLVRNLSQQEADVADRIQKEKKDDKSSPVPTAKVPPGSGPRREPSTGGGSGGVESSRGSTNNVPPPAAGAARTSTDRIAFVSAEPANDIYVMNLDGSGKRRLGAGVEPDWSPDGKRIAFARGRTDAGCTSTTAKIDPPDPCDVWVMNADGSNQRRLAAGWAPDWSPDGKRIAYGAGQDSSEIHVMNADGSGSVRITHTPNTSPSTQGSNSPSWSPDGNRIAFSRRAKCGEACWTNHLYVVNSDGSRLESVAGLTEAGYPAWSPDGKRIAFTAHSDNNAEIFTVDLDDEVYQRLTEDEGTAQPMENHDGYPAWSFDGRLAFVSDPDGPTGAGSCGFSGTNGGCGTGGPAPPRISLMDANFSRVIDVGEGRMPDFAPRP